MAKKATPSFVPTINPEFARVVLMYRSVKGFVSEKISTFIPVDLTILDPAWEQVGTDSRRVMAVPPEKALTLYKALGERQSEVLRGGGEWLLLQGARHDMNAMHAYASKAGDSVAYRLILTTKVVPDNFANNIV